MSNALTNASIAPDGVVVIYEVIQEFQQQGDLLPICTHNDFDIVKPPSALISHRKCGAKFKALSLSQAAVPTGTEKSRMPPTYDCFLDLTIENR
jgi:hypothetical protein